MKPYMLRRLEVFKGMVEGKTNLEIARTLNIPQDRVRSHVHHILAMFAVPNRYKAVVEALRQGLITVDSSKLGFEIQMEKVEEFFNLPPLVCAPKPIFSLEGLTVFENFEMEIALTPPRREIIQKRPYALLRYLADPLERFRTRQEILDAVWGIHSFVEERVVDKAATHLRKILVGSPYEVESGRSLGYRLARL